MEFGIRHSGAHRYVGHQGLSFCELLTLVNNIRSDLIEKNFQTLGDAFQQFVQDMKASDEQTERGDTNDYDLPAGEVGQFLQIAGLAPSTHQEQDAFNAALQDHVEYHNGEISGMPGDLGINGLKRLLQRLREQTARWDREAEIRTAAENSFDMAELQQLQDAYNGLDKDGSGSLDNQEVWHAANILNFGLTKAVFDVIIGQFDQDGLDGLSFREFIVFVRQAMDRVGAFAGNHKIMELHQLSRAEIVHIFGLLGDTPSDLNAVERLSDDEILNALSERLGISRDANLKTRHNIRTFQDLCSYVLELTP